MESNKESCLEPKIAQVRRMIVDRGVDVDIEVDGGISPATIEGAARAVGPARLGQRHPG